MPSNTQTQFEVRTENTVGQIGILSSSLVVLFLCIRVIGDFVVVKLLIKSKFIIKIFLIGTNRRKKAK